MEPRGVGRHVEEHLVELVVVHRGPLAEFEQNHLVHVEDDDEEEERRDEEGRRAGAQDDGVVQRAQRLAVSFGEGEVGGLVHLVEHLLGVGHAPGELALDPGDDVGRRGADGERDDVRHRGAQDHHHHLVVPLRLKVAKGSLEQHRETLEELDEGVDDDGNDHLVDDERAEGVSGGHSLRGGQGLVPLKLGEEGGAVHQHHVRDCGHGDGADHHARLLEDLVEDWLAERLLRGARVKVRVHELAEVGEGHHGGAVALLAGERGAFIRLGFAQEPTVPHAAGRGRVVRAVRAGVHRPGPVSLDDEVAAVFVGYDIVDEHVHRSSRLGRRVVDGVLGGEVPDSLAFEHGIRVGGGVLHGVGAGHRGRGLAEGVLGVDDDADGGDEEDEDHEHGGGLAQRLGGKVGAKDVLPDDVARLGRSLDLHHVLAAELELLFGAARPARAGVIVDARGARLGVVEGDEGAHGGEPLVELLVNLLGLLENLLLLLRDGLLLALNLVALVDPAAALDLHGDEGVDQLGAGDPRAHDLADVLDHDAVPDLSVLGEVFLDLRLGGVRGDAPNLNRVVGEGGHGVVVLLDVLILLALEVRHHDQEAEHGEGVEGDDREHHIANVPTADGVVLAGGRRHAGGDPRERIHGLVVEVRVGVVVEVHVVRDDASDRDGHEEEVEREVAEHAEVETHAGSEHLDVAQEPLPGRPERDVLAVVVRHRGLLPQRLRFVVVEGLGHDRELVAHGLVVLIGVDGHVVVAEAANVAAGEEPRVGGIGGEDRAVRGAPARGGSLLVLGLDGLVLGHGSRGGLARGLRLGGGVIVLLVFRRSLAHGSHAACDVDGSIR